MTNIHEAKTHLSKLVERVEAGEEIVIGRAGKPVAKLVPFREVAQPPRKPGSLKGKIRILPGFDEADKEIEQLFYASEIEPSVGLPHSGLVAERKQPSATPSGGKNRKRPARIR